jgi:hypothetical protein
VRAFDSSSRKAVDRAEDSSSLQLTHIFLGRGERKDQTREGCRHIPRSDRTGLETIVGGEEQSVVWVGTLKSARVTFPHSFRQKQPRARERPDFATPLKQKLTIPVPIGDYRSRRLRSKE